MDLTRLRKETEADHARTEAAVPLMDDSLSLATYLATLGRMHGFLLGWESWAKIHVPDDLRADLDQRLRSPLIQQDLRFFGQPVPDSICTTLQIHPGRASFLGAMYVMEGSTLGGQYLAAHVEKLFRLRHGVGNEYFVGYGARTGSMWNSFKALLTAVPEQDSADVIESAKGMFRQFEHWMSAPGLSASRHQDVIEGLGWIGEQELDR